MAQNDAKRWAGDSDGRFVASERRFQDSRIIVLPTNVSVRAMAFRRVYSPLERGGQRPGCVILCVRQTFLAAIRSEGWEIRNRHREERSDVTISSSAQTTYPTQIQISPIKSLKSELWGVSYWCMAKPGTYHDEERLPAVAGMFYPGDPLDLSKMLTQYLSASKRQIFSDKIRGIISPHAGYIYSGQVAASAYKELEGLKYDTVVIIAPSHTTFFQGASVYNGSAYVTPLGKLFIDQKLASKITEINPSKIYLSNKGHTGGGTRQEHSLEVQLPFLQMVLGDFKLVPIVMAEQEWDVITALGDCLATALKDTNSLIVASTDLSHFYSSNVAAQKDGIIRSHVEAFDPQGLYNSMAKGQAEACGGGPMAAAMIACRKLGASHVAVTDYADSSKVSGDQSEVVGYLAAVIYAD